MDTGYQPSAGEHEYNHGFATIALTPSQATVTYYQVSQATAAGAAVPLGPPEVYPNPNGGSTGAVPAAAAQAAD